MRPWPAGRIVAQQPRAHHGREGKGDDCRDQDGHAQHDGELAEQPADDVAHEKQGNEYRDQRNGQRQNGEADLPRTFEGRAHGILALLDITGDIFDHDDGIVHDETGEMVSAINERLFKL